MTSYEFEVAAKNAVAGIVHEQFGEDYDISSIQMVWFAHMLGNKKAVLIDHGVNHRFYEVTLNAAKNELYVDMYDKLSNTVITEVDTTVHAPCDK